MEPAPQTCPVEAKPDESYRWLVEPRKASNAPSMRPKRISPKPPDRPTYAPRLKPMFEADTVDTAPLSNAKPWSSIKLAFSPPPRSSVPRRFQRLAWPPPLSSTLLVVLTPPTLLRVWPTQASTMPPSVTLDWAEAALANAPKTSAVMSLDCMGTGLLGW